MAPEVKSTSRLQNRCSQTFLSPSIFSLCVRYLVVLAHSATRWWVLALQLLSWHPLAGIVGGGQWPRSVRVRVLPLLVRELVVWSILLPAVVWLWMQW